jgi:hypothetical protein
MKLPASRGLHSHVYQKVVYERLSKAVEIAKLRRATDAQIADAIKAELGRMSKSLEDGEAFW